MNNIFNTKCSKGSVKAELIKTEKQFPAGFGWYYCQWKLQDLLFASSKIFDIKNLLPLSIIIYFERIALMLFLSTRMADFVNLTPFEENWAWKRSHECTLNFWGNIDLLAVWSCPF